MVPLPVRLIACGLSGALSVMVIVPVRCPAAVGEKVTAISQVPEVSRYVRLEVQVLEEEKSPVVVMEEKNRRAHPLFDTVMYSTPPVSPSSTFPKFSAVADKVAVGSNWPT